MRWANYGAAHVVSRTRPPPRSSFLTGSRPGARTAGHRAVNSLVSSLFVAGFYYSTFKWPGSFWEQVYVPLSDVLPVSAGQACSQFKSVDAWIAESNAMQHAPHGRPARRPGDEHQQASKAHSSANAADFRRQACPYELPNLTRERVIRRHSRSLELSGINRDNAAGSLSVS